MKIRPLYDRIVVKRIEEKEQMQGGLYIPDSAKEKPQEGEVVSVGKGKRLEDGKLVPLDVAVGRPARSAQESAGAGSCCNFSGGDRAGHGRGRRRLSGTPGRRHRHIR